LDFIRSTSTRASSTAASPRLRLEKSSVSRLVADLEQRALLHRERDEANRRLYRLRLTALLPAASA
jgi:DNA-binding MarR family transcriptional regulator